jgi:nifR3 family TIM-barrel protein
VTIKIRTGWDDQNPVYLEVGTIAERAGAAAITLHARSRSKGYAGKADWTAIRKLKESVGITVIGNGDVRTPHDVKRMLDETGCDGVMLGRAALGNPFIFGRINRFLQSGIDPGPPGRTEKIKMANLHARLMVSQFGLERGMKMMRRYLGWYVKGMPGAAELRPKLFQVERLEDIDSIFSEYLSAAPGTEAAGSNSGRNLV